MRGTLVAKAALGLGLAAIAGSCALGNRSEAVGTVASTTTTTERWGAPLRGGGAPSSTSLDRPGPAGTDGNDDENGDDDRSTPAEPITPPPGAVTESGSEGETGSETDLAAEPAAGQFPISSNASEDYPLEPMVQLAVEILRAELTGEGRARYPHLAGQVEGPCCAGLVVDGAVVLFGETVDDPARIMLEWHAVELDGGAARQDVTETRWWWSDGVWQGEHERDQ